MLEILGRSTEEKDFERVLKFLVSHNNDNNNPDLERIFLFDGYGGIGKTALLKRLREISQEKFPDKFNSVFIDWQDEYDEEIELRIGLDHIAPTTVMEVISNKLQESFPLWKESSTNYQDKKLSLEKAKKEIERVEEKGGQLKKEELEKLNVPDTLVDLAAALGEGIGKLVEKQEKPLLIFFDTYEIVGSQKCDSVVRQVINEANHLSESIIWLIAGRFNLAENTWRNEEVKSALFEALEDEDGDVVKAAIESLIDYNQVLEVKQLVDFLYPLERKNKDRYIRESAVRALEKVSYSKVGQKDLELAVKAIVETVRKDEISDVRNAATASLKAIYNEVREELKKLNPPLDTLAYRTKRREEKKDDSDEILHQYLEGQGLRELPPEELKKVALLRNLLHDKDPDIISAAIRKLGEVSSSINDTVVLELIQLLDFNNKDSDRYLREEVAKALGKLTPTKEIVNALNLAYRQDVISDVRDAAKSALEEIEKQDSATGKVASDYLKLMDFGKLPKPTIGMETSITTLTSASINSSDDRVVELVEVALSLGSLQQPELVSRVTNVLTQVLESQNPSLVAAAADSLGKIGNLRTLELLLGKLEKLEGRDWIARKYVVKALGELQSRLSEKDEDVNPLKVIKVLIDRWRNDPIRDVRGGVESAVKKIYIATRHLTAYKALNRYPFKKDDDNFNNKVQKYYQKFFDEYPPKA